MVAAVMSPLYMAQPKQLGRRMVGVGHKNLEKEARAYRVSDR